MVHLSPSLKGGNHILLAIVKLKQIDEIQSGDVKEINNGM
jgi:hypothetical protein